MLELQQRDPFTFLLTTNSHRNVGARTRLPS